MEKTQQCPLVSMLGRSLVLLQQLPVIWLGQSRGYCVYLGVGIGSVGTGRGTLVMGEQRTASCKPIIEAKFFIADSRTVF